MLIPEPIPPDEEARPRCPAPTRALLERDQQLAAVLAAADAARAGAGRLLLIEAAAGLGKTSVLTSACERLAADGVTVLRARGSEMEQEYGYGVVRQLLERTLADGPVRDRVLTGAAAAAAPLFDAAVDRDAPAFAVLHGLYWAVANLAQDRLLVLAVDDAQLADQASLRFLVYLARRVEDLGVLLLVATRPAAQAGSNVVLDELRREAGARHRAADSRCPCRPSDTSCRTRSERSPDAAFATACARATGGNPFYLEELLRDAAVRGVVPTSGQRRRRRAFRSAVDRPRPATAHGHVAVRRVAARPRVRGARRRTPPGGLRRTRRPVARRCRRRR